MTRWTWDSGLRISRAVRRRGRSRDFDRQAMARQGLTSRVVGRYPERLRSRRDQMDALPVTTPEGRLIRLGDMRASGVSGSDLTGVVERARAALDAGIPLVLAGDKPGNEIESPMVEVILGGLLSSTFLNLVVVPVLFRRWGEPRTTAGRPGTQSDPR